MEAGFEPLRRAGVEVVVRQWHHEAVAHLQRDNLLIEQGGPSAVQLPEELTHDLAEFDLLSVQFAPVSASLIDFAAKLRVIAVLRVGVENVAVAAATERGIAVLNTPGRNARAVAEFTVGVIFGEVRNIARSHAALKQGDWRKTFPNSACIPELHGKTVGLVGYGYIGFLVAGFLNAFGCRLLACDPYAKGDPHPAQLVDLPTLLRESDVITIHARLTEESHHLIGAPELAQVKPTAVLINTARSGLVDETALINALQTGRLRGAALDVFDEEPLPPGHPFLTLDNVTLTPHLAGGTRDAFANSPKLMANHLLRMLAGQGDLPVVNGVQPAF